ncbi:unnamed protein product [Closterium sp. NIES-64]|nr:unnamed protein product [Closterium sp. NIES-64]
MANALEDLEKTLEALDELPLDPDAPSRPASSPLDATGLPPSSDELPLDPDAPSCPATSALDATGLPPSSGLLPPSPGYPSPVPSLPYRPALATSATAAASAYACGHGHGNGHGRGLSSRDAWMGLNPYAFSSDQKL